MKEQSVEDYLVERVEAVGGETRKVQWIGRRHAPDRRVMHPKRCAWVELKRPGEKLHPGQAREHARMLALGEDVVTLTTFEEVDEFMLSLL